MKIPSAKFSIKDELNLGFVFLHAAYLQPSPSVWQNPEMYYSVFVHLLVI